MEPTDGHLSETMVFVEFRGDGIAESKAWQILQYEWSASQRASINQTSLVNEVSLGYPSSSGPLSISIFKNEIALKSLQSSEIKLFKLCSVWQHYDPISDQCQSNPEGSFSLGNTISNESEVYDLLPPYSRNDIQVCNLAIPTAITHPTAVAQKLEFLCRPSSISYESFIKFQIFFFISVGALLYLCTVALNKRIQKDQQRKKLQAVQQNHDILHSLTVLTFDQKVKMEVEPQ